MDFISSTRHWNIVCSSPQNLQTPAMAIGATAASQAKTTYLFNTMLQVRRVTAVRRSITYRIWTVFSGSYTIRTCYFPVSRSTWTLVYPMYVYCLHSSAWLFVHEKNPRACFTNKQNHHVQSRHSRDTWLLCNNDVGFAAHGPLNPCRGTTTHGHPGYLAHDRIRFHKVQKLIASIALSISILCCSDAHRCCAKLASVGQSNPPPICCIATTEYTSPAWNRNWQCALKSLG